MGSHNPHKIKVVWLIGERGAIPPPDSLKYVLPADLYRRVDASIRYAVGWNASLNQDDHMLVMDIYNSVVINVHPYVEPHWVEGFDGMDHALAALTITYHMDAKMRRDLMNRQSIVRTHAFIN